MLCLLVSTLFAASAPSTSSPTSPPPALVAAPRSDVSETVHGVEVADPYRPLEEMSSAATRAWIADQDGRTRARLDASPLFRLAAGRLDELTRIGAVGVPVAAGGRLFYLASPPLANRPSLWVKEGDGARPRRLLDGDAMPGAVVLTGFWPSPDGERLAYALGEPSSSWAVVRFLSTRGGEAIPDELRGLHAAALAVAWSKAGDRVYYGRFDEPVPGTELTARHHDERLLEHALGTPSSSDRKLFDLPRQPTWTFSPQVSEDGRWLVLTLTPGWPRSELRVAELGAPGDAFRRIGDANTGTTLYLASRDGRLLFSTDQGADRSRIASVDVTHGEPTGETEVVPEDEDPLYLANAVAGRIVAVYLHDARHVVRVFSLDGRFEREVALPDLGTTFSGFVGRLADRYGYYSFNSVSNPPGASVFRLDPTTGESVPFERPELGFDPARFVTSQVFFRSKDGTRVPMYVSRRADLARDRQRPVLLYGYGGLGWAATPWYQPHVLAWLERGGVYAIANVRGGGEYGESWHQAGIGAERQNAIDDYVAATEWLLASGWTAPGRIAANGGSLSGALAANAVLQRPELYGAALIDIPVLDLLRYERFTGGDRWVAEFGSPATAEGFARVLPLSPYHALKSGRCYPPMLVTAGEKDETAVPLHAYKFVARLQESTRECASTALLQVVWGGGHGYGTTREQRIETWARQLAFLDQAVAGPLEVRQSPGSAGGNAPPGGAHHR